MDRIEKIEDEVRDLSSEELAALREWFHEFDAEVWDRRIESDGRAEKLDSLANQAIADYRSGKSSSL